MSDRLYHALLAMAGRAPDEVLTAARRALADGQPGEAATAIADAAVAGWFLLTRDEADLLAETVDDERLAQIDLVPAQFADQRYDFLPALPTPGQNPPTVLDLTAAELDRPDAAAVAAVRQLTGVVALYRAWRSPRRDDPAGGPARIYLLETTGDLADDTASVQAALDDAEVANPQVESYPPGHELAPYQRLARGRAALLYAAAGDRPVTIARVFDMVDPVTGPRFADDHALLADGDEPGRVLDYLNSGRVLLATTARATDVFNHTIGEVVPLSYRTDGTWIWTDTVAYYLGTYGLSPDPGLLAQIKANGFAPPDVDDVSAHRALVELTRPIETVKS